MGRGRMTATGRPALMVLACVLGLAPADGSSQDEGLPAGFRFVGNYKVERRVKIREGKPFPVAMEAFLCRVYTDGISVRIYGDEGGEGYTSFTVYRNDGVMVPTSERTVETMPGVQAKTSVGDVLRHLTLTEDRLVLTKFPALSDLVEVTYANRLITLTRN